MDKFSGPYKPNICIVNSPIYGTGERRDLDNHICTLEQLCSEIFVIAGNFPNRYGDKIHIIEIGTAKSRRQSIPARIARQLIAQLKLAYKLIRLSKNFDIVLFDIGQYRNILPTLCSKLLRKETIVLHRGSNNILETKLSVAGWQDYIILATQTILLKLCYRLADHILCDSPSIISAGKLERYRHKILIHGGNFMNSDSFQTMISPVQRENVVGYIGRLTRIKGIINLARAIPMILEKRPDVRFLLAGDGEQRNRIEKELQAMRLNDHVTFSSWVPDNELPEYLSHLKLFVLPSYEEGVPNMLREAMAYGTIVLATPVGGIPDITRDEKTGFIMDDNTPECIAENVLRALDYPQLDRIARDARALIEKESSFEATVERWRLILEKARPKAN